MKKVELSQLAHFNPKAMQKNLVHDSAYMRVINFNLSAGQVFPVHSHELEGQLSIVVLEGEGAFLGADDSFITAKRGDVLLSDIAEPHGVRADTDMRILVTIAPPI